MFVRRSRYISLWNFCRKLQEDNDELVNNNRQLRSENIALEEKIKILEKKNEQRRKS